MSSLRRPPAHGLTPSEVEDEFRGLLGEVDAAAVARMLEAPPELVDLPRVAMVDAARLPCDVDRVGLLKLVDRQQAAVDALRLRTVLAVAGVASSCDSMVERQVAHEVAVGLRISKGAAERLIDRARTLVGTFPGFVDALEAGEVVLAHCLALIEETAHVTDDAAVATIGSRALPRAKRRTPADFRRIVRELVAVHDTDAAARRERAKDDRNVRVTYLPDGMATLHLTHERILIDAIASAIESDADVLQEKAKGDALASVAAGQITAAQAREQLPTADHARADAAVTRFLGVAQPDGSVIFDRTPATITAEVVIDLETLLGLREGMATINGEPVAGSVARELAERATWWRRVVTDPVDGHLMDYGDRTYLPQALKRFVSARDQRCRACGSTRNLQMDHAEEFPTGHSCTANCGLLCLECHQRKTLGLLTILESQADGSATFQTAWGQRFTVRPRPYLPDPDRDVLRDQKPDPPPEPPAPPIPARPPQPETPPF
jgi:hypothetical protein